MNFFQPLAPATLPPPQPALTTDNGGGTSSSSSSSIIIVSIVISSAIIISFIIYLLLRFRRSSRTHASAHPDNDISSSELPPSGLDSLPLFKFGSVSGGDCAVCLSKFDPEDQLRLLPLCCHAFHAQCIDKWLSDHQTCPLCRSTVYPSDSDVSSIANTGFRVQMGSASRRRGLPDATSAAADTEGRRMSYPIGSFEYIVDDGYQIPVDSTEKEAPPGETLVAEPGSGRNWLKDYVDRLASFSLSSNSTSFRSSGRNDAVVPLDHDLEANPGVGEEISELFRWISGV